VLQPDVHWAVVWSVDGSVFGGEVDDDELDDDGVTLGFNAGCEPCCDARCVSVPFVRTTPNAVPTVAPRNASTIVANTICRQVWMNCPGIPLSVSASGRAGTGLSETRAYIRDRCVTSPDSPCAEC